ncbi:MAG: 4Fe-4S dicluster domain-containing protein [Anaerobutyricum sp.]
MLMNRTTPFMVPVDDANPAIIKNEALCSECGHCFAVCEEEIGVAAKYLLNQREAYQCIGCGQCSASCPEKAITGRPHYKIVKELIKDPEKSLFFLHPHP